MALKLVRNFTVSNGTYSSVIDASTPLTITQDGGVDDITAISPTYFYMYNDGKRRDPIFDPPEGTTMSLSYESIVITPKSFSTTIINGASGSNGTSTRLYLSATSVATPATLKMEVGTVLTIKQGSNTEDVLIMKIGGDSYGSWVDVIRNYKNSSTILAPLDAAVGNTVDVSVKHIYMSATNNFGTSIGGQALTMPNVSASLDPTVDGSSPSSSKYQTIYIKAVPQLQKTGSPQITRIPTQFKTDVYFEISYRELPL